MSDTNNINIALVGAVSVGKSTLLNAIFGKTYSDCMIKRTTMTPQVYCESNKVLKKQETKILAKNREINQNLIKKTENQEEIIESDIQEVKHFVPRIPSLTELIDNTYLNVFDIPGLNDARTHKLYFQYLEDNFYKFDIIIFVVDIYSALNTSDEITILTKIIDGCKSNSDNHDIHNKLIIVPNKCDDMTINSSQNLILEEELDEMLTQIKTQVKQKIDEIYPELEYNITPLSSEHSYIYRSLSLNPDIDIDIKFIDMLGSLEYGRTRWNRLLEEKKRKKAIEVAKDNGDALFITGFTGFLKILTSYLTKNNQYRFITNHINYGLQKLLDDENIKYPIDSSDEEGHFKLSIGLFNKYYIKCNEIDKKKMIHDGSSEPNMKYFEKYFGEFIERYKKNTVLKYVEYHDNNTKFRCNTCLDVQCENRPGRLEDASIECRSCEIHKEYKDYDEASFRVRIPTTKYHCSIKEERFIGNLEQIIGVLKYATDKFESKFIVNLINELEFALVSYYSDQINLKKSYNNNIKTSNNIIDDSYKYLLELNTYLRPSNKNIQYFITNDNMINCTPQKIIEYLEGLEDLKLINRKKKISYLLKIINSIYSKIRSTIKNSPDTWYPPPKCTKQARTSYIYYAEKFWSKFVIKYDDYDHLVDIVCFTVKFNLVNELRFCLDGQRGGICSEKKPLILENYFLKNFIN